MRRIADYSDRHDEGVALVTAIILVSVAIVLSAVVISSGVHSGDATARDRSWVQSQIVAEAGVQNAIVRIQGAGGVLPSGTITGTTNEGSYAYTVTALARNTIQVDSTGTVGTSGMLRKSRKVRALLAPPKSFKYALFSLANVDTKNNNNVVGDVWANQSVTVYNNDTVTGSVSAATGAVTMSNGSHVTGDVSTGGYDASSGRAVELGNNARIDGAVKASSTTPGCTDDLAHAHYTVTNGGTIGGSVTAWGNFTGTAPGGTLHPFTCGTAPAAQAIPTFRYNAANYTNPQTFASPAAFTTYLATHKTNLSGTFYVAGGDATHAINLTGVTIGGDTTIIAESAPIDASSGIGAANNNDKILVLVSFYSQPDAATCTTNGGNPGDCAIGLKNNFIVSDQTATLLYAPNGPISFKNNADFVGAVYGANIQLKNNMNVTYDSRVNQVVGFGPVTYSVTKWLELPAG